MGVLNCVEIEYVCTVGGQLLKLCIPSVFSIAIQNVVEDCSQKLYAINVKIQLFHCGHLTHGAVVTYGGLQKRHCSTQNFLQRYATLIQLKSVATTENRNQCVYAVIAPAPSARASNQYKTDV